MHHSSAFAASASPVSQQPYNIKTVLKNTQATACEWIRTREQIEYQGLLGGMFCDPPGMGKTLSLMAGMADDPAKEMLPTLIVVPPQVINVWVTEFAKHTDLDRSRILIYYGPKRHNLFISESTTFIITTYNILRRELDVDVPRNLQTSEDDVDMPFIVESIFNFCFYRIILDEAHFAKNYKTMLSCAITHLKAQIKWVVTATPSINSPDDEYSYFRFLELIQEWREWRDIVPNTQRGINDHKLERLREAKTVLDGIKMEISLCRDKSLLKLPPKMEVYLTLPFSKAERKFYDVLQIYCLSRASQLEMDEDNATDKNVKSLLGTAVLQMIGKLKQATNNCMFLVDEMVRLQHCDSLEEATEVLKFYNKSVNRKDECTICLDQEADHKAPCCHQLCKPCWQKTLKKIPECPMCYYPVTMDTLEKVEMLVPQIKANKKQLKPLITSTHVHHSTKIQKMLSIIDDNIGKTKVIIVSQSLKMLDYAQARTMDKYSSNSILRIDGRRTVSQRNDDVDAFQKDETKRILFFSLTCNPEGITLTKATVLIHLDHWWNKDGKVEQVNDRIHRISQLNATTIYYISIVGTIEEQIFKLQEHKSALIRYDVEGLSNKPKPSLIPIETFTLPDQD